MSNCIEDLFDYDLVKKCCRCKNVLLKSNFYKNKTKRDGYAYDCVSCRKEYYNENRDKIKKYRFDNKDKINEYFRKRKNSDLNFKLASNLRSRTSTAFKSQNVRKTNKTLDLLGCSHLFFKGWIIHQLYGLMTLENYGTIWCLDHCLPLSKINENDLCKYTNWVNIRPMYIKDNISKGCKIDHHLYLLQEVKAKYFLKLNNDQQGVN